MKTILATTYAVNPYKGSENGMGWNFVCQIAAHHKVIAITRKNNQEAIDQYMEEFPKACYANMEFRYYDLPYWMRFWKKGGRGALLYYYLWQMFLPVFVLAKRLKFDITHNVNFHNDWTPSFLWILLKPMVWGPIGHHPKIPHEFAKRYGKKFVFKERLKWLTKQFFWYIDPFVWMTRICSRKIICMNTEAVSKMFFFKYKCELMPSVNSEIPEYTERDSDTFTILSVGRFVPLKGFDITVDSFALFYNKLTKEEQQKVRLKLVGSGSELNKLRNMIAEYNLSEVVEIVEWIPRKELLSSYEESDVFFFPSHEGAGMVVAEAMSYRMPVVCFNNAGPGEFVDDTCALRVDYGKYDRCIEQFSMHLLRYFQSTDLYQQHAKNAFVRFSNRHSWEVRGRHLKQIYNHLEGGSYEKENRFYPSV